MPVRIPAGNSTRQLTTAVRKIINTIGFAISAAFLVLAGYVSKGNVRLHKPASTHATQAALAVACISASNGASGMGYSGYAVNMLEIAPRFSGIVKGIANTAATVSGIVAPIITGRLVPWFA